MSIKNILQKIIPLDYVLIRTQGPGQLEAINVTKYPNGRDSVHALAEAGVNLGDVGPDLRRRLKADELPPGNPGDYIAIRRRALGETDGYPWILVQIPGKDVHNIDSVPLKAVALPERPGEILLGAEGDRDESCSALLPPNTRLAVVNARTQERHTYDIDASGTFPLETFVPGLPTDTFQIFVSDGTHNTDLKKMLSQISVHSAQEEPTDPLAPGFSTFIGNVRIRLPESGPLKAGAKRKIDDIEQGGLGNCFVLAPLGGIAAKLPDLLGTHGIFRSVGQGNHQLRVMKDLGESMPVEQRFVPTWYEQTSSVAMRLNGKSTAYAAVKTDEDTGFKVGWVAIFEKLFASHELVNQGKSPGNDWWMPSSASGSSAEVLSKLLGTPYEEHYLEQMDPDALFEQMSYWNSIGMPLCLGTRPNTPDFNGKRLISTHAHTVLDVYEKDGKRFVVLRNPWGDFAPEQGGPDDGVFTMEWEELQNFVRRVAMPQKGSEKQVAHALERDGLLTPAKKQALLGA